MIKLTRELIRKSFANNKITDEFCDTFIYILDKYGETFGLMVNMHIVRFLAQAKHEVEFHRNGKPRCRENLNYSCKNLMKISRFFRNNTYIAKKVCRNKNRKANQIKIANYMYSTRLGNGDYYTNDGYRYRGFGIFQLTGKANFIEADKEIYSKTGKHLLLDDGSLVETLDMFILSGLAFWSINKLNECASTNCVTFRVNSGLPHVYQVQRLKTAKRIKNLLLS